MKHEDVPMFLRSVRERALENFCEIVYEPELAGDVSENLVRAVVAEAMDYHGIGSSEIRRHCEGAEGRPDFWRYGESVPASQEERRRILSAVHRAALDKLSSR